ncbi:AAA family ATPase [Desulfovibrio desulfuricans]|uniref:AAA family ATPase n=1 Tax=Desulfovibrio desulfuricans TaxID=876 RepID=UPI001454D530|nr:AAA family ATPase [Desulfovibrio desulfuricans]
MNSPSTTATPNLQNQIAHAQAAFFSEGLAEQTEGQQKRKFTFQTAADIINALQQIDAIKGIIPSRGIVVIYGPSGSGKSFLAVYMAYALGYGLAFFGFKTQVMIVVYINLEGSLKKRLESLQADKKRNIPDNILFVTEPFHIIEDIESLAADIPEGAVVFIDTMNAASPGLDENSSRDMGLILEAAKKLQQITKGLVVIVHHSGKDASKGLRGHSSLYAAMDAVIEVGRNGDSRYWRLAKSKEGRDGIRRGFRLKSVGLGYDADGEPVTSCVVEEDNTPLQEEEKPLAPALAYCLESLQRALVATGKDCVHLEEWRPHFYERHTGDTDGAKRAAFNRDKNKLVHLGKIRVQNDNYSLSVPAYESVQKRTDVRSPITSSSVRTVPLSLERVRSTQGEGYAYE